jgi:hypothetical protein
MNFLKKMLVVGAVLALGSGCAHRQSLGQGIPRRSSRCDRRSGVSGMP